MFVFNVRLLSELPLAIEMGRRLMEAGKAFAICFDQLSESMRDIVHSRLADLNITYFDLHEIANRMTDGDGDYLVRGEPITLDAAMKWINSLARSDSKGDGNEILANGKIKAFVDLFARQLKASRRFLKGVAADVLIVCQDGVSGNGPLIKAARDLDVPVIDCPYGFGSSRDFNDYLDEKHNEGTLVFPDGPFGVMVREKFPKWVRKTRHGDVLMFPPEFILVREFMGMSLALPWVVHGGASDYLCAESEVMLHHYQNEGIEQKKIKLIGTVYCDALYEALCEKTTFRTAFEQSSKICPGRTSVLIALPPSYHETRPGTNEFDTYEELCRSVINLCRDQGNVDCTLSVHPTTLEHHSNFLQDLGIPISQEWLVSLIAKHDIYLTAFSSTIRWAIACGKPVVNYNMYGYNCQDYEGVDGVFTMTRFSQVKQVFENLLDDDHYVKVAKKQKLTGKSWGMVDGQNFDRFMVLIENITKNNRIHLI